MTATGPRHVLLVDDNLADVTLTLEAAAADPAHLRLHHVLDAVDALAWLARQGRFRDAPPIDLILLDVNMPRINGLSLLRALKESAWEPIPVVMFTTSARERDRADALAFGALAFWTKPTAFDDLIRLMGRVGQWAQGIITLAALVAEEPRR